MSVASEPIPSELPRAAGLTPGLLDTADPCPPSGLGAALPGGMATPPGVGVAPWPEEPATGVAAAVAVAVSLGVASGVGVAGAGVGTGFGVGLGVGFGVGFGVGSGGGVEGTVTVTEGGLTAARAVVFWPLLAENE